MGPSKAVLDLIIRLKDEASAGISNLAGNIQSGLAVGAVAGVLGLTTAITGVGVAAFNVADQVNGASNQMQASLGLTNEEAAEFEGVMESIYANNFGENFDDIAQSISTVESAFVNVGGAGEELQGITEDAIRIRDVFGEDIPATANAAATLVEEFGITGEQAMDLIANGFQNGLNRSGDFLDTIGEYSTQFSEGGADVEQFFSLLESGLQGGMLGTDKAADLFKEFRVRIQDGSSLTAESLEAIGINSEDLLARMANGTTTAADAWQEVQAALATVEDDNLRMQVGVGLMGTQYEDLGQDAVAAMDMIGVSLADVEGATESLDVKYDNLGSVLETLRRNGELALLPLGDGLLDIANEAMPYVLEGMGELQSFLTSLGDSIDLTQISENLRGAFGELTRIATGGFGADLYDTFDGIREVLMSLGVPLEQVDAITDALFRFEDITWAVSGAVQQVGGVVMDTIEPALESLNGVVERNGGTFQRIFSQIGPIVQVAASIIGVALTLLLGLTVGAFNGIVAAIDPFLLMIANMVEAFRQTMDGIWQIVQGVINLVVGIIEGDGTKINAAWEQIVAGVAATVTGWRAFIEAAAQGLVNTVLALVGGLVDGVIGFFANLYEEVTGKQAPDLVARVSQAFEDMKTNAMNAVQGLWNDAVAAFNTAKTRLAMAAGVVGQGVYDAIMTPVNNVVSQIKSTLNQVIGVLNQGISSFNTLPGPDLPLIPGFANGTFSAPGGLALVGERGPELVYLNRGDRVVSAGQSRAQMGAMAGAGGGGGNVIFNNCTITGEADENRLAWKVMNARQHNQMPRSSLKRTVRR